MTKRMFRQFNDEEKHVGARGNAFGPGWSKRPNWLMCADGFFHMVTTSYRAREGGKAHF